MDIKTALKLVILEYNRYTSSGGTEFFDSDDYRELEKKLVKNVRNK